MRRNWVVESGSTPGHLKVVGTCSISGEEHAIEVPAEGFTRWQSGTLIQVALPNLSPDDREFLISGMTPAEWDQLFN